MRNTDAGSVEAHLEGDVPAVEALLVWLAVGPSAVRVTGVGEAPEDLIEASTFEIAY